MFAEIDAETIGYGVGGLRCGVHRCPEARGHITPRMASARAETEEGHAHRHVLGNEGEIRSRHRGRDISSGRFAWCPPSAGSLADSWPSNDTIDRPYARLDVGNVYRDNPREFR